MKKKKLKLPILYISHKWNWTMCDLLCLTAFASKFVHAIPLYPYIISFLWVNNISFIWQYHNLLISCWTFGLFPPFGTMNNSAINTDIQVSISLSAFNSFSHIIQVILMDHMKILLDFWTPFYSSYTYFTFPPAMHEDFNFYTSLQTFVIFYSFDQSHPSQHEVVLHFGFDLQFHNNWWYWAFFFLCLLAIYISLKACPIKVLCPL